MDIEKIYLCVMENFEQMFPRPWFNDDDLYDSAISYIMPALEDFNRKESKFGRYSHGDLIMVSVKRNSDVPHDLEVSIRIKNGTRTAILTPISGGYKLVAVN
jgi:hypothetical protein